ncbi:MAG: phosphotransferase family protein [Oscillospiraceae bacterium]
MNDLQWERSTPLLKLDLPDIDRLLQEYDCQLTADSCQPIGVGCRNTNYIVSTSKGRLLLRFGVEHSNSESAAAALLHSHVAMPELFYKGTFSENPFYIYEYIEGISLQEHTSRRGICENAIIEQVAQNAAALHSFDVGKVAAIGGFVPPPFETWFPSFLSNERARARLGNELLARIYAVLERHSSSIRLIATMEQVPIHSDFRPANMLITPAGKVYVVDWEGFGTGHALGDIGQFFRFRQQFGRNSFDLFSQVYNGAAKQPLPENWVVLALLRDMVNPLQMLGFEWNAPNAQADFTALLKQSVDYLSKV